MIVKSSSTELPTKLESVMRNRGWQTLRPGQVYALFWDQVLSVDTSDADKLMERVMEIHKLASSLGVNHMFKTVRTAGDQAEYPELF